MISGGIVDPAMKPVHLIRVLSITGLFGAVALTAAISMSKVPTMKAVRIHAYGGTEAIVYEDAPRPKLGEGDVLLRIQAAGVNPVDWKLRSGWYQDPRIKLPLILGFDVCGVVESVGSGVKKYQAGDEVFCMLSIARGGGYAEYAAVPESELARKPRGLDAAHAAGVPLAALTAWQALFDKAELAAGQTLLIHGGSGGVGHFAVQFAKAKGAKVVATASAANQAFLKELGADQAIDYRSQKFEELVQDVDVVLDLVGADTLERSYSIVKKGGFIVSLVAKPDARKLEEHGLRGSSMIVQPNIDELGLIAKMIEEGTVKPHVGATFPLAEAAKAHEKSQGGGTPGKIVLLVR